MTFSRWRNLAEFMASNAFRKEVTYRLILSPTCSIICKSFAGCIRELDFLVNKFGDSPAAEVRLCFNGLPVCAYVWQFPYAFNRKNPEFWQRYVGASRS